MLTTLLLAAATATSSPAPPASRPPNATYTYAVTANGAPIGSTSIAVSGDTTVTLRETAAFAVPLRLTAVTQTQYDATLHEIAYGADFTLSSGTQHTDVTFTPGSIHVAVPGQSGDIAADPSAPLEVADDHLIALQMMLPAVLAATGAKTLTLAELSGGRAVVASVADTPAPPPPAYVPAGDASVSLELAGLRVNYYYDPATYVVHAFTIPLQGLETRLTQTTAAEAVAPTPHLVAALPTPLPHFSSRDVTFRSADGTLLAGTFTLPERGRAPFPAVVFVHGSGPQDRDETIGPNAIFLQLSNALSNAGVAVLRYDKRGVAKSGGAGTPGTRDELLADIRAAFAFARTHAGVDPHRVFLLGHSEGGELVPTVAANDPAVAGIILLAPPALPLWRISLEQTLAIATPAERAQMRIVERTALDALRRSTDAKNAWLRSTMDVDPSVDIARVRQPILIFQGTGDVQVLPADLPRLVRAARAHNHAVTVHLLANDNHLFEPVAGGPQTPRQAVSQYLTIPERIDPRLPAGISAWIRSF